MSGVPPRAWNWNFMDFDGGSTDCRFRHVPLWKWLPAAKKGREPEPSLRRRIGFRERHSSPN